MATDSAQSWRSLLACMVFRVLPLEEIAAALEAAAPEATVNMAAELLHLRGQVTDLQTHNTALLERARRAEDAFRRMRDERDVIAAKARRQRQEITRLLQQTAPLGAANAKARIAITSLEHHRDVLDQQLVQVVDSIAAAALQAYGRDVVMQDPSTMVTCLVYDLMYYRGEAGELRKELAHALKRLIARISATHAPDFEMRMDAAIDRIGVAARGLRFRDSAADMVTDLGDAIRTELRAFACGVDDMARAATLEMVSMPCAHAATDLPETIGLTLRSGKSVEVDYRHDGRGRAFSVGVYGPGTFAANAGLTDEEAAEVRAALDGKSRAP